MSRARSFVSLKNLRLLRSFSLSLRKVRELDSLLRLSFLTRYQHQGIIVHFALRSARESANSQQGDISVDIYEDI